MKSSRNRALLWCLRIVVAGIFLATSTANLSGSPQIAQSFVKIGLGKWFQYLTGVLQVCGALLVLWPRTTFFGALLLLPILAGALLAQMFVLHGDVIHVLVIAALTIGLTVMSAPSRWLSALPSSRDDKV